MAVGVAVVLIGVLLGWMKLTYYLPPDRRTIQDFERHRADYVRFVAPVEHRPYAGFIDGDGAVEIGGAGQRGVPDPDYRRFIRKIGAKFVVVGRDGSVEIALWGSGCAICQDSYMGVRYVPQNAKADRDESEQTVVASLASARLPHVKRSIVSGLYVIPIEPQWFIYRSESE